MLRRRRKEISFCIWGVIGFAGFVTFVLANMFDRGDDAALMAGAGLFTVLAAVGLHGLTCTLIERFSPPSD